MNVLGAMEFSINFRFFDGIERALFWGMTGQWHAYCNHGVMNNDVRPLKTALWAMLAMMIAMPMCLAQPHQQDSTIYRSITQKIQSSQLLNQEKITVNVRDGLVGARGEVSTIEAHDELVSLVQNTSGVAYFVNAIFITGKSKKSPRAISQNVNATLKSDPRIDYLEFHIEVNGSHCHLAGRVLNSAQAHRAEKLAKRVKGIRTVSTSLQIMP